MPADPNSPPGTPPAEDPDLAEDANALPDEDVAIELPLEPGDPDAQPQ